MAPGKQPPVKAPPPRAQRAHKPHELGPRIYFRGRWAGADLRPWGGERCTLRNPSARGWPDAGDRTDDLEVAERWKWTYVDYYRDGAKRKQLGLAPRERKSFAERVEEYILHRERTVGDRTVWSDRTGLRTHLLPALGTTKRIDAIERVDLQQLVNTMLDAEYQVATVERMVSVWSAFFAWLGRARDDNPAHGLVLPDPGETDVRAFTDDELVAVREAADRLEHAPVDRRENRCTSIRVAIELALGTGGRQKELMALDWTQFRAADRTVRFTHQLAHDRSGLLPLKGKVARTSLVLPSWWTYHRDRARGRVLSWAKGVPDVSTSYLQLQLVYDIAGVNEPGMGWHTLRHTYARLFLELGGRLEELQRSLGHQRIATTEKHYTHFTPETAAQLARARIYGEVGPRLVFNGGRTARGA